MKLVYILAATLTLLGIILFVGNKKSERSLIESRGRLLHKGCTSAQGDFARQKDLWNDVISNSSYPEDIYNKYDSYKCAIEKYENMAEEWFAFYLEHSDVSSLWKLFFVDKVENRGIDAEYDDRRYAEKAIELLKGYKDELAHITVQRTYCLSSASWQSGGLRVVAGDRIYVWAKGEWKGGPSWQPCGPDGTDATSLWGDYRIFKGSPLMSLMCRVSGQKEEGTAYGVGAYAIVTAPTDGVLRLRCNDSGEYNNEGTMEVQFVIVSSRRSDR